MSPLLQENGRTPAAYVSGANFKTRSLHYLRRPQASFRSPEGEETLGPPPSDLRSPGIISKHGGFRAPDGDSARIWERE